MLGGWPWVMVCCGAIQSAIGFSMVYGTVELGALYLVGYLPPETVKLAMDFWYVMIVIPALGSGLLITIHSWTLVFRERRLSSLGGAAWNTYAQAQNTFDAINGIGPVWKAIRSEERRVGKECVRTCRCGLSPDHKKKKKN